MSTISKIICEHAVVFCGLHKRSSPNFASNTERIQVNELTSIPPKNVYTCFLMLSKEIEVHEFA